MQNNTLYLWTDGGARGNPGPAAIGVVATNHSGEELTAYGEYIGETTNNIAEYKALLSALIWSKYQQENVGASWQAIHCHLDSQLVVYQLIGKYRVKDMKLQPLFAQIQNTAQALGIPVTYAHIPREENKRADALVNHALDART